MVNAAPRVSLPQGDDFFLGLIWRSIRDDAWILRALSRAAEDGPERRFRMRQAAGTTLRITALGQRAWQVWAAVI